MLINCQCCDPGCPMHPGISHCTWQATRTVFRIDMEDRNGTPMCDDCAEDALASGVFYESIVGMNEEVSE